MESSLHYTIVLDNTSTLYRDGQKASDLTSDPAQIRAELLHQFMKASIPVVMMNRGRELLYLTYELLDNMETHPCIIMRSESNTAVAHTRTFYNGKGLYIAHRGYGGIHQSDSYQFKTEYQGNGIHVLSTSLLGEFAIQYQYDCIIADIKKTNTKSIRSTNLANSLIKDYIFHTDKHQCVKDPRNADQFITRFERVRK